MKRALIITYYWPPTGGSGVQRWVKFSRHLPEFGWQPVIYTPENPEQLAIDESLLADIPAEADRLSELIAWAAEDLRAKKVIKPEGLGRTSNIGDYS